MAQAIITATKAPIEEKELTLSEKLQSTEWRFAVAYVKNDFNLTKAAMDVFEVGKKGAKTKFRKSQSAGAMGSRMLNNAKVKEYVAEITLNSDHINPNVILERFGEIMRKNRDGLVDSQINLGMKMLEHQGIIQPVATQHIEDHRHVHLVIPPREDD